MLAEQLKLDPLEIKERNCLKLSKPLVYDKVINYDQKLRKGESVALIQLQYNYICNFHCSHCSISVFQHKKGARSLTLDDIRRLSEQADQLGLAQIGVSGGEPLLFKDLDQLIEAIDPAKFYIQLDTNGWLMTDKKAIHLKSIGVDKIQLSFDSLSAEDHDAFRRRPGSYERALRCIDSVKKAGLNLQIATVVTPKRLRSEEFVGFLEFAKSKGVAVSVCWPKPVGEWAGNFSDLVMTEDIKYLDSLRSKYHLYEHLTPSNGLDVGCVAVKRIISITQFGEVLPCPWMYFSLGNIFDQPLEDILKKGMKYFNKRESTCLVSSNKNFVSKYITKTYGRDVPVPIEEILPLNFSERENEY